MAEVNKLDKIVLYLMPERIQKQRLRDIKAASRRRKFKIVDTFCAGVTHVVTECDSLEQVLKFLLLDDVDQLHGVQVLSMTWLTACLKNGRPVEIEESQRIRQKQLEGLETDTDTAGSIAAPNTWACQRITCLQHHNPKLTTALEVLEKHAQLRDGNSDYSRALAFRKASCVLKSLPHTLTDIHQLRGLKDIGNHSAQVIEDILEEGFSNEVEEILNDPWFIKMKLFSSVFGVGSAIALKWIERGWEKIEDAQNSNDITSDWRVQWGLAFHDDLTSPVLRQEADNLLEVIREEATKLLPGVIVEIVGGFRRGKMSGHDADFLLTHPDEGSEIGLLPQLLQRLQKRGFLLAGQAEKNSFTPGVLKKDFKLSMKGQLDHFEKWIGIMKLPKSFKDKHTDPSSIIMPTPGSDPIDGSLDYQPSRKKAKCGISGLSPWELSRTERAWCARRVDLIISPFSQYYYGLVGWTGSKHFNRDLRTYSQKVLNMKVTSHGLFDFTKNQSIPAHSEKEVFDILKLPYHEPWQRNC
ncbi:hypothetical protein ScPMuIL_001752 [Solemya velum]